jgi:Flp pilus assembly protein TadD
MSTRKVTNSIFVLCLFGIFVSNALSASPETMLIGKWKYFKEKEIEFVKDGTLIIGDQGAKYRVIDRERIEFDLGMVAMFSNFGGPRPVFRFTVSNDELTLIPLAKPNKSQKLRRVKVDASGNDQYTYLSRGNKNLFRNPQEAIKDCEKAIELDPKFADLYISRGIAYINLFNPHEAIKNYNKVIELDPKSVLAYINLGLAYDRLHNYKEAIKDYDKAIELDPKSETAYSNRGRAHSHLGNHHEAIKDCSKAIELNPKSVAGYSNRGYAYSLLGNYPQGIKDIEHSIHLWPDYIWSYYNMACIFSIQNNADLACQWLKKAIEKGYKDWKHLKGDKDFDSIRNTSCFQEIIKSQ